MVFDQCRQAGRELGKSVGGKPAGMGAEASAKAGQPEVATGGRTGPKVFFENEKN